MSLLCNDMTISFQSHSRTVYFWLTVTHYIWMQHRFCWRHSLLRVYYETFLDKVNERVTLIPKFIPYRQLTFAYVLRHSTLWWPDEFASFVKLLILFRLVAHPLRWLAYASLDQIQRFSLASALEDWPSSDQFNQNAAERPHVDSMVIGHTKHDLRTSVVSTLNVGVAILVLFACRSKVYNLHVSVTIVSEENILWLQITVDIASVFQMTQASKDLRGNSAYFVSCHTSCFELFDVAVQVHVE